MKNKKYWWVSYCERHKESNSDNISCNKFFDIVIDFHPFVYKANMNFEAAERGLSVSYSLLSYQEITKTDFDLYIEKVCLNTLM